MALGRIIDVKAGGRGVPGCLQLEKLCPAALPSRTLGMLRARGPLCSARLPPSTGSRETRTASWQPRAGC